MKSLGERCVEWCLAEMEIENPPATTTLDEWFSYCVRGGRELRLQRGVRHNHCAAAQCAAARACAGPGERAPHSYRAAAKELMADALESGAWIPKGKGFPKVGDLAIYDRSTLGKPETSWYGHVDRVTHIGSQSYQNIGANEGPGGAWRLEETPYDHPRLLGFIRYPDAQQELTDEDRRVALAVRDLSLWSAEAIRWDVDGADDGSE